jgi:hypothetical protein
LQQWLELTSGRLSESGILEKGSDEASLDAISMIFFSPYFLTFRLAFRGLPILETIAELRQSQPQTQVNSKIPIKRAGMARGFCGRFSGRCALSSR